MSSVNQFLQNILSKFKRYIENSLFLFAERAIVGIVTILSAGILARYLGPNDYGLLSYAISLAALFGVISHAGLSGIAVLEIKKADKGKHILGSIFSVKILMSIIGFSLLFFSNLITFQDEKEFLVIAIASVAILFNPFEVFDYWFQAQIKSKYPALARISASILTFVLRLALIYLSFNLIWLVVLFPIQALISTALYVFLYKLKNNGKKINFSVSFAYIKSIFSRISLTFLSTVFAMVSLRIDQIMVKNISGLVENGYYSAAVTLSELWYVIPIVIAGTVYPRLIELKESNKIKYEKYLQIFCDLFFIVSFLIAVFITFFSDSIIMMIYGEEYLNSSKILIVHIWGAIFIFFRALQSKWIIIENLHLFSVIAQALGAFLNIILNYYFIPDYGGLGAAWATIISYAFSCYLALLLHKRTRKFFIFCTKSFIIFIRYPIYLLAILRNDLFNKK